MRHIRTLCLHFAALLSLTSVTLAQAPVGSLQIIHVARAYGAIDIDLGKPGEEFRPFIVGMNHASARGQFGIMSEFYQVRIRRSGTQEVLATFPVYVPQAQTTYVVIEGTNANRPVTFHYDGHRYNDSASVALLSPIPATIIDPFGVAVSLPASESNRHARLTMVAPGIIRWDSATGGSIELRAQSPHIIIVTVDGVYLYRLTGEVETFRAYSRAAIVPFMRLVNISSRGSISATVDGQSIGDIARYTSSASTEFARGMHRLVVTDGSSTLLDTSLGLQAAMSSSIYIRDAKGSSGKLRASLTRSQLDLATHAGAMARAIGLVDNAVDVRLWQDGAIRAELSVNRGYETYYAPLAAGTIDIEVIPRDGRAISKGRLVGEAGQYYSIVVVEDNGTYALHTLTENNRATQSTPPLELVARIDATSVGVSYQIVQRGGAIGVDGNDGALLSRVSVYDALGRVVASASNIESASWMSAPLTSGWYTVEICDFKHGCSSERVVIAR